MAINPTAPLTPISPAAPPGSQPHSVVLQAVARAALANLTQALGEPVGAPTAGDPREGVELADKAGDRDAGRAMVAGPAGDSGSDASAARAAPVETRLTRAVRIAAAQAVPRQAGLAPLMADVAAMLEHPETPLEVRSAGAALLARIPPASEMVTARELRTAVEQSGVFLEARLARGGQPEHDGEPLAGSPETDLKAGLLVFKDALSGWLARTALTPPTPGSMESPPCPPSAPLGADPFSEASAPAGTIPQRSERDADVSGAHARSAGPSTNDDDAVEPRFAAFIAPSEGAPSVGPARPASPALGLLDLAQGSPGDITPTPAPLAVRGYGGASIEPENPSTPPPPFADGPMAGQRPTRSQLPAGASSEEIVRRLLKGVSAALSRQVLMQIASLREVHQEPETDETRTSPARLNLDLPFATPQGVAVAQFEITREGGGGAATGSAERTYRVRFSIDVEPLGPVHALVMLAGKRARVSLWAARSEIIASLRASQESLGAALRQAELTPEIAIHSGPPPVKDAGALGHFVDQAS